jgi:DNA-binding NtrC family response regulator
MQRVTRVGDTREREVDVRVVAATNRDLDADVAAGRFRRDLFFRLGAAAMYLPPLRHRPSELGLLAHRFLVQARQRAGRAAMRISEEAMVVLLAHVWPGNIRELKNLMQYMAATVSDDVLLAEHLAAQLGSDPVAPRAVSDERIDLGAVRFRPLADEIRELEALRMCEALEATRGNQTRAAALLAMPVRTFFAKAKQYGLTPGRTRAAMRS